MQTNQLSGYTVAHNAIRGDYCLRGCIDSLLLVCAEVVVGHAASDDGTGDMLDQWAANDPRLRIIQQPWHQPVGDKFWFVRWINDTRQHLRHPCQLMLDADEVLDPQDMHKLLAHHTAMPLRPLRFHRLNFWRNVRTVIPEGCVCGSKVTRYGPTAMFMPSDEPYSDQPEHLAGGYHPGPEPEIRVKALRMAAPPRILHYGFCRSNAGLYEKCKVGHLAFKGSVDVRVAQAEAAPDRHWSEFFTLERPFTTYHGQQPSFMQDWLRERNAL